jgi:hypothetical protein
MTGEGNSTTKPAFSRRVVIENVLPQVDCGRFPIKRVVGDQVQSPPHLRRRARYFARRFYAKTCAHPDCRNFHGPQPRDLWRESLLSRLKAPSLYTASLG